MYASIRRYEVDQSAMDDLLHRVDTGFAEEVSARDGFVAYECVDCGDGGLVTISMFRDRAAAEDSAQMAAAWIRDALSDIEIKRTDMMIGEVAVSRARDAVLQPAHH
jgi:hypothetical protein